MKYARLLCVPALLLLPLSWAAAQEFDFQPPALASDPKAPAVMRDLAERVLPVYQENDTDRYLANLSALQLVAGSYAAATATRQSLRDRRRNESGRPDGGSVVYDIYAQARAEEAAAKVSFRQAFAQAFRDTVSKLSDQGAYFVTSWRGQPLPALQRDVQLAFDRRRARNSISIADAVELVRLFLAYEASRSFEPLLPALDAEDDQRRYTPQERVLVPSGDGSHIVALIVRPRDESKPLPTLLEFTIYVNSPTFAKECAAHGYAGVVAYTRELREGPYRVAPYETEGEDARAVIDWIVAQPWSDGRVGMYGSGYSGFTPWAAARQLPPALKAIAASSPNAPGVNYPLRGGIYRNSAYRWAYNVTNRKGWDDTYNDARWRALEENWYRSGKSYFELDHTDERPNRYFHRWMHHPSYDGFWQKLIPYREQFAQVDIPVLTTGGYFGGDFAGALYYFTEHHRYNSAADDTLLIGPYDDGAMERAPSPVVRGYELDPAAVVDLRELRFEWFDSVFKGAARPALLADRVNFEVMGANEWRHAGSLDAMADAPTRFYLDAAATEPATDGGHLLATAPGPSARYIRQTVSLSDRSDAGWMPPFSVVGQELPLHDALSYVSEPLSDAIELSGTVSGRLDFTVNRQDLDLTVALYELLPSGGYLALFDPSFAFRASYARDRSHRQLLRAGERQRLAFSVERITSRRLQAGSRLVVVLGVNKTPEQQVNYGSGDDVSAESLEDDDNAEPIDIRWYAGSYLDLPLRK